MKKIFMVLCTSLFASYALAAPTCEKLQDDYNLIYAAKGFCFKDPDALAKYGNNNCHTNKPRFSEREQQRLDQIKEDQKTLNCK